MNKQKEEINELLSNYEKTELEKILSERDQIISFTDDEEGIKNFELLKKVISLIDNDNFQKFGITSFEFKALEKDLSMDRIHLPVWKKIVEDLIKDDKHSLKPRDTSVSEWESTLAQNYKLIEICDVPLDEENLGRELEFIK